MNSLARLRQTLLDLHKIVLDAERREYERDRGRLRDADFLRALIEDPALAWLKPLTALIACIDEVLEQEEQGLGLKDLAARLRALLAAGADGLEFQRKYADVLQRSPDALVAHVKALRAMPS